MAALREKELAMDVLERANVAAVAWRTVWKGRAAGADVSSLFVGWVLYQQQLAKSLTQLILACDQMLEPTVKALEAAALDKKEATQT